MALGRFGFPGKSGCLLVIGKEIKNWFISRPVSFSEMGDRLFNFIASQQRGRGGFGLPILRVAKNKHFFWG